MDKLEHFIASQVPGARLVERVGTELTFILPTHQKQNLQFPAFFRQLNDQREQYGVDSYGISDTTLEEVGTGQSMFIGRPGQPRFWAR